jgi:hypothetical protein
MARRTKPPAPPVEPAPPIEPVLFFGEVFRRAVLSVMEPFVGKPLPGMIAVMDGPAQRAIEAFLNHLLDRLDDHRRELDQLRIKGRRVVGKETLVRERLTAALRAYGHTDREIRAILNLYDKQGDRRIVSDAAIRQRASRATRRRKV